jgi:hypothetical protein
MCSYAKGFHVLAEDLGMFRLGAIATGENMIPSDMSLLTENLVGWMSASWTQKRWTALAEGNLGGRINHFGWRRPWLGAGGSCPFWIIPLHLLKTEEEHGKPVKIIFRSVPQRKYFSIIKINSILLLRKESLFVPKVIRNPWIQNAELLIGKADES